MISLILSAALGWVLFIVGSYFLSNPTYLGAGLLAQDDFLSGGYLFSKKSLHFIINIVLIIGSFIVIRYFKNRDQRKKKKKKTEVQEKFLTLKSWQILLFLILDIFLNIFLLEVFRGSDIQDPFAATLGFSLKFIPGLFYLLVLISTLYGAGSVILKILKVKNEGVNFTNYYFRILAGFLFTSSVLMLFGFLGLFRIEALILFVLFILILSFKELREFFSELLKSELKIKLGFNMGMVFFTAVLITLFVNGIIDLTRPIGIGWDDITRYLNYPKLLGSTGVFPSSNFGWPVLVFSSLGFTSGSSEIGHIVAFLNSFFYQLLLLTGIIQIARLIKTRYSGLLVAVIFFTLPMVVHHLVYDSKTDIALTAILVGALFAVLHYLKNQKKSWLLVLAGLLLGFAIGIKITGVLGVIIILGILVYFVLGRNYLIALYGIAFITVGLFGSNLFESSLRNDLRVISISIGIIISTASLFLTFKSSEKFKSLNKANLKIVFILIAGIVIGFSPMLIKNLSDANFKFSFDGILIGNNPEPELTDKEFYSQINSCTQQGFQEEVVRYIGYEDSVAKYLKLPWNLTMNNEIGRPYVDIGFYLLAFIPICALIFYIFKSKKTTNQYLNVFLISFILSFSLWTIIGQSVPWYAMFIFLIGFILIEAYFTSFSEIFQKIDYRLTAITSIIIMCFGYIAVSIHSDIQSDKVYLFIFGFIITAIVILILGKKYFSEKFNSILFAFLIVGMMIFFGYRGYISSNKLVFAYATNAIGEKQFIDQSLYGYRYFECALRGNVWLRDTFDCLSENSDESVATSPVYRIGTFVNYFVDENNTRIFEDSRLDKINCLLGQKKDEDALQYLKDLGFKYLVYDTNSATIENDTNGPVHQKVDRFVAWIQTLNEKKKIAICFGQNNSAVQFISLNDFDENDPAFVNCRISSSDKILQNSTN